MFTGIIEDLGKVTDLIFDRNNLNIKIKSNLTPELKIDQSISHNGVCLTVVDIINDEYTVTAVKETLMKSNLGNLSIGDSINLERAMKLGDRLDGHIVQGHIDQTAICKSITEQKGSWLCSFEYETTDDQKNITIKKGSITVNGVSLTVIDSFKNIFSVTVIPYTYKHTTFNSLKKNDIVNLEFDVVGKYIQKLHKINCD